MSSSESYSQSSTKFRARRGHQKSRNGCFECKRRKIKCDESKPSCGRCVASLKECIYPRASLSASKDQGDVCLPTPLRILPLPPNSPSYLEQSSSSETPTHSTPVTLDFSFCCDAEDAPARLSDADLYHHYIQHTSRTLTYYQRDQIAMQIGIPTLALRNKTVFHSLLALSAACLGCDMISKYPPPDVSAVNQVLMRGYQHYNLASEQLREMISELDALKVEPLLASNILLVPFSAASQQIKHWISSRSGTRKSPKPLSSTPRDVIVIMRGIRTMLQALDCPDSSPDLELPEDAEFGLDGALEFDIPSAVSCTSHTHVMFPILAATTQEAFAQLQERLDSAERNASSAPHPDSPLSACITAFEVLDDIRIGTFSSSNPPALASPLNPKQAWLPQVAPSPTEPLTRTFLSFLVQVPQSYLNLVMPLLEQRLETASGASADDSPVQLTAEQALALDIYAYWSVFMFLVEEESWWIGSLPVVTLVGMLKRYGDLFVEGLRPEQDYRHDRWWPGAMLTVLQEFKRDFKRNQYVEPIRYEDFGTKRNV